MQRRSFLNKAALAATATSTALLAACGKKEEKATDAGAPAVATAKKTGRVVVVYEAPRTCGFGAEISALIAERAVECPGWVQEAGALTATPPHVLQTLQKPAGNGKVASFFQSWA